MRIEGEGFRKAVDGFQKLPDRIARNVLGAANREAMRLFLARAQTSAPVRKPKTSGAVIVRTTFKGGRRGGPRAPGYLKRQLKFRARRGTRRQGKVSHVLHKGRASYLQFVAQGRGGRGQGSTPNTFLAHVYRSNRSEAVNRWAVEFVRRYRREVQRLHG